MHIKPSRIPDVIVIEPSVRSDGRGYLFEVWQSVRYGEHGLPTSFVQDNISRSTRGTVRGLHLQEPFGQGKLVHVVQGEVFDVGVDVRVGSPTFGEWIGETLSDGNHRQIYIPPGFAHGFCVVSDVAILAYKCTEIYRPETELSIAWNDPGIGIPWPVVDPKLSEKDARAPRLSEIPIARLPKYALVRPVV